MCIVPDTELCVPHVLKGHTKGIKVVFYKSRGEIFSWNRIWDLGPLDSSVFFINFHFLKLQLYVASAQMYLLRIALVGIAHRATYIKLI